MSPEKASKCRVEGTRSVEEEKEDMRTFLYVFLLSRDGFRPS